MRCNFIRHRASPRAIQSGPNAGKLEQRYICEQCGFVAWSMHNPDMIFRRCKYNGVGDHVSYWLAFSGLTKYRYSAMRSWLLDKLHLQPHRACGCASRQEKLNRLGWRLTQLWRREHRLFTVAIVGTTVAAWLAKWLLF